MVAYNPVEALQVNVIPHFKALEVFTIEVTSFFSCTADDYLPLDKRAVILRPSPLPRDALPLLRSEANRNSIFLIQRDGGI